MPSHLGERKPGKTAIVAAYCIAAGSRNFAASAQSISPEGRMHQQEPRRQFRYKALLLGQSGKQVDVRTFDSTDDLSAIDRAKQFEPALGLELWSAGRMVVRLPHGTVRRPGSILQSKDTANAPGPSAAS